MIISTQQQFSDGQNVTADAASTNLIDLGATGTVLGAPAALVRDIGKGTPVKIVVQLDTAAGGTSPTVDVTLQMDTTSAFSSPTTIATAPQKAAGAAGDRIALYWVPDGTSERYIRLHYNVGGTSPDYTFTSFVTLADQTADGVAGV